LKWEETIVVTDLKRKIQDDNNDENNKKKSFIKNESDLIIQNCERKNEAEYWLKSYLKKIGSTGVIHSINIGKTQRLILCNVRNLNICKVDHEDYFNDSTFYINLAEKLFPIRCNRIPCNKKPWIWEPMF